MTTGDDVNLVPLTYPCLFAPILDKLEANSDTAAQLLRNALVQADTRHPGFLLHLVKGVLEKSDLQVNLQEAFLRQQANLPLSDYAITTHPERPYQDLSQRAFSLRKILARIPDEMSDRRQFLETIKDIASSIKKLLDATNAILVIVSPHVQPAVEQRKREFVKYSKRFSNTLKEYFRGEQASLVYMSGNQLIYHTGMIVKTVRLS